jgi:hypothetical protein
MLPPPTFPPPVREGGAVRTVANPVCCTWCETFPRLLTVPLGIPNPAVPFCTSTREGRPPAVSTGCPTTTVAVPRSGGAGVGNRFGGFVNTGIVDQPPKPPGAHIQP